MYRQLKAWLKRDCPPAMRADREDDGTLTHNIANMGLQVDQVAERGSGEYNGFAIRPHKTPILPLITDQRVVRALEFLEDEKPIEASRVMQLQLRETFSQLYYALARWLRRAGADPPREFLEQGAAWEKGAKPDEKKRFDEWLLTTASDPIAQAVEVADAGRSDEARGPVVPEEWVGRTFPTGRALHRAMDGLEWRRGRSPVSYCCCYFMRLRREGEWGHVSATTRSTVGVRVRLTPAGLSVAVTDRPDMKWFGPLPCQTYQHFAYDRVENVTVAVDPAVFAKTPRFVKRENAGVLVTRLQKCNRRGRGCAALLARTLEELVDTRPYNLPDQQMLRVSGSKQAAWRLFVTTFEDSEPWEGRIPGGLSMLELAALALAGNADPGRQWSKPVTDLLVATALAVQRHDGPQMVQEWTRTRPHQRGRSASFALLDKTPEERRAILLLLRAMPMSGGDRRMLESAAETARYWRPETVRNYRDAVDPKLEARTVLASYDMISSPHLLIMLQSCTGSEATLGDLSARIWRESSGANVRRLDPDPAKSKKILMRTDDWTRNLLACQKWLYNRTHLAAPAAQTATYKPVTPMLSEQQRRVAFLLVFGREHRFTYKEMTYEVTPCGTAAEPLKVRRVGVDQSEFTEGALRAEIEAAWRKQYDVTVALPAPPVGWQWRVRDPQRVRLRAETGAPSSFMVDDTPVKLFDGSSLLEPMREAVLKTPTGALARMMDEAAAPACSLETALRLRDYTCTDCTALETRPLAELGPAVWRIIRVKLRTLEADGLLQCGPVDPMGNRLQNFVHPHLEGIVWRAMSALCAAYPRAVRPASNLLNFTIEKASPDFVPLLRMVDAYSETKGTSAIKMPAKAPALVTRLWPHQERTRAHIVDGTLRLGKRGHGDASNVGAGKTLTALSVVHSLLAHNYKRRHAKNWAVLIMVPTEKLYKTWRDQLETHTRGFTVVEQQANGSLASANGAMSHSGSLNLTAGQIQWNTVVIATMGRMREHPLDIPWIIVVIDECLTVQNRNALQTGEAWRQVAAAQYGCLLLSATFFRSRIDKLYFMLRLMQTGIPEEREFLTAILGECIVCNVPKKETRWTQHTTRVILPPAMRKEYDRISAMNLTSEKLYGVLAKYLYDNFDYASAIGTQLAKMTRAKMRVLVFARSREEADLLAEKLHIARYPELEVGGKKTHIVGGKKTHIVGTVAECGYGVNDLVCCDAILCRPQNPDVLPQLKGRIDRPGQTKKDLHLEYILVGDTIEEANLVVLEMASRFRNKFIMPLAEFYDIAVRRKK